MGATQPLLDVFERPIGAGRARALISFKVRCEFPLIGGHIFSFVPRPEATAGAVPVGMTEPAPGQLVVEYLLDEPVPTLERARIGGFRVEFVPPAALGPIDPFKLPLNVVLIPASDVQWLVALDATGPDQGPGSPTVQIAFNSVGPVRNVGTP